MTSTQTMIYRDSGQGAISNRAWTPPANVGNFIKVKQIKFTLGSAATLSDVFTGDIVSAADSAFNGSLSSQDMIGAKTFIDRAVDTLLPKGDKINFNYTNSANAAWGIEIVFEGVN